MVEEILLTDVNQGLFQGILVQAEARQLPSLERLYIRWIWDSGYESLEARLVTELLRCQEINVIEEFAGEDEGSTPMQSEALFNKKNGERRP